MPRRPIPTSLAVDAARRAFTGRRAAALVPWLIACGAPTPRLAPEDLDRTPRPPPEAPAVEPCEGQPYEIIARGYAYTRDGWPVAGVPVGRYGDPPTAAMARTRPDGAWQVQLPGPTRMGVLGYPSWPRDYCLAVPRTFFINAPEGVKFRTNMVDINFLVDPTCPVRLALSAGAAPTAPLDVRVATADGVVLHEQLPAVDDLTLAVPCTARGVLIHGGGLAPAPTPNGCGLAPGWTCLPRPDLALALQPAATATLTVRGPDGPVTATVETPWGVLSTDAAGALTVDQPAPAEAWVRADGFVPQRVRLDGAVAVTLRPGRAVEVRCAGHAGDRCPVAPAIRGAAAPDAEAWPCELVPGWGVRCVAPAGEAAVLIEPGARVVVPATDAVGWLDHRGGATVRGRFVAGCHVDAVRQPGWTDALAALVGRPPRVHAASATCGEDGAFVLDGLDHGTWTLTLDAGGVEAVVRQVTVAGEVDLGEIASRPAFVLD